MNTIWYFGLEPLNERYTHQLCEKWMPDTFENYKGTKYKFEQVRALSQGKTISVGSVLDATGRGYYALGQCQIFMHLIKNNGVKTGDVIFLQDFWTPGIESIFYALDLYGIKVRTYSMIHAQSVDEYDFTYQMKDWIRFYELGLDSRLTASFVGSTIHRDQLRAAGFKSPIHVVSLPIDSEQIKKEYPVYIQKHKFVVFSSRLDKEKNPYFMLKTAKAFLKNNPDWMWMIVSSGNIKNKHKEFYHDVSNTLPFREGRLLVYENLSKEDYYKILADSKIQFNCSLQDYVSWTALEAAVFNCNLVYPNFRSFKEIFYGNMTYMPFNVNSALEKLEILKNATMTGDLLYRSELGRQLEAYIVCENYSGPEINIWHEKEYVEKLLNI